LTILSCATKQLKLQNDKEKKNKLEELWQKIITEIDSFENNCIRKIYDLDENKIRRNQLEKIINSVKLIDLEKAEYEIKKEEINLLLRFI